MGYNLLSMLLSLIFILFCEYVYVLCMCSCVHAHVWVSMHVCRLHYVSLSHTMCAYGGHRLRLCVFLNCFPPALSLGQVLSLSRDILICQSWLVSELWGSVHWLWLMLLTMKYYSFSCISKIIRLIQIFAIMNNDTMCLL